MRLRIWWGLLRSGGFRVHLSRLPMAVGITLATPINSILAGVQKLLFRSRLKSDELQGPPVFILGHWRSGTTLLHELMVLDDRYSSPSTYQCFAPHHFLVTQWFFRRFASWLLPGKRPMDNMDAGWDRPQEDEFALMNLGMPSPYRRIAFPNQGGVDLDYLDFEGVSEADRAVWAKTLRQFMVGVGISTGRPLIMKSPTHTGRLSELAREFPDAKFIHITRDPRALFPSTCRLWQGLDAIQALQVPNHDLEANHPLHASHDLQNYVVECLRRMYGAFHQDCEQIPANRLIHIKYEELIADPVATLTRVYQDLHLSDFETVKPTIQEWVRTKHRQYKPNQHDLHPDQEALIRQEWRDYFQRYQYE